jgi:UDP-N-acetylglucosamine--N-acetylmuramyl-(pentapeptide) pyrophosphoryl-undecaprenol N-acetylglucosamine transferase
VSAAPTPTDGVRVVVVGGHSAGHIEPAMAVADAIRRLDPSAQITALGTTRGLDTRLVPARGYPLELIPPVPLPRKPNRALLATPAKLAGAVRAASRVLARTGAEAVVGFGGYVSLPAYLAGRRYRLPLVVHEANARPGLANLVAARLTKHVFTASAQVRLAHATPIGIPLRPAISGLDRAGLRADACARFGLDPARRTLLVFGGSQGAQSINRAVRAAAPTLGEAGIQILHIAGPANAGDVPALPTPGPGPAYVVLGYVDRMDLAYAAADFAVCRSGAMTCAELSAVGLPAAYIPLPLRGGEQRLNAVPIVRAGGGLLVTDAALSAEWIVANVVPVLRDGERLEAMSRAAAHAGSRDADTVLARYVIDIVVDHRRHRRRPRQ